MAKILLVEDDDTISFGIRASLEKKGYEITACTCLAGAKKLFSDAFALVLLDLNLPDGTGYELCTWVKARCDTPIIFLTVRDEVSDITRGLDMGADDYVTKPFGVRELMARVKANLRKAAFRAEPAADAPVAGSAFERLDLNPDRYEVRKDGKIIDLTLREFELLKFLSGQKGQVFSRETLLEKVWGYEYFGDVRTVDVTIRRLREKIEDDPGKPVYILTKRGVGYYFDC